ncbi:hypothetical protein TIFTF001_055955, partial [Ficus carica]
TVCNSSSGKSRQYQAERIKPYKVLDDDCTTGKSFAKGTDETRNNQYSGGPEPCYDGGF